MVRLPAVLLALDSWLPCCSEGPVGMVIAELRARSCQKAAAEKRTDRAMSGKSFSDEDD